MALAIGDKAPDFNVNDQDGNNIKLSDYLGKKVILYFYPKDQTPGCTAQSCNLRDHYGELKDAGYEVLGISWLAPNSFFTGNLSQHRGDDYASIAYWYEAR